MKKNYMIQMGLVFFSLFWGFSQDPLQAQDRWRGSEKPGPIVQPVKPQFEQVAPAQNPREPTKVPADKIKPPCPDMAVTEIQFTVLSSWKSPSGAGRSGDVRISAVAVNVGKGTSTFSGQLVLLEAGKQVVAKPFGNIAPGGSLPVDFTRKWFPDDPLYKNNPPSFTGKIIYDPAVIQNKYDQDCNWQNNELTRSGKDINGLFPNP
jgi:hypothetical protein